MSGVLILLMILFAGAVTALVFGRKFTAATAAPPRARATEVPTTYESIVGHHESIERLSDLLISRDARITSGVSGRKVVIEGWVGGGVTATEQVVVRSGATIHGTIRAPRIEIQDGVSLPSTALFEPRAQTSSVSQKS